VFKTLSKLKFWVVIMCTCPFSQDTHPNTCPVPGPSNRICGYRSCNSNDECWGNNVCCKVGCTTLCRYPKIVYCKLEGQQYRVNDTYSPEPCTVCLHFTLFKNHSVQSHFCFIVLLKSLTSNHMSHMALDSVIQLAYRISVVLIRCTLLSEIMHEGTLSQIKLESRHKTF
jgi:hypothetical protein